LEATVEVAHEALFTCWERLKNWIVAGKRLIFVKNRLADDSGRWKRVSSSDPKAAEDELWAGSRLEEALGLRARNDFVTIVGGLSEDESRFLDLSGARRDKRLQEEVERGQKEEEQRQRELDAARKLAETERQGAEVESKGRRRQHFFIIGLVGLLFLAGVVAVIAIIQRDIAEKANREASRQLGNVDWLLGVRARDNEKDVLRSGHFFFRSAKEFQSGGEAALAKNATLAGALASGPLVCTFPHDKTIFAAVFSRGESRILTWSQDGTARLWAVGQNEPVQTFKHEGPVDGAVFSRDESRILTWSRLAVFSHQPRKPSESGSPAARDPK
jgi:WD40 repeat protein